MSILTRFKDIMASNINALLDKAEDPEKMVDQTLRNLNDDLAKVKSETAAVMAAETKAKRDLDNCKEEVNKYTAYAQKAVDAGNDDDARKFLVKKNEVAAKLAGFEKAYEIAKANADQMKQMHDKLQKDINILNERRQTVKTKVAVAKTKEHINKIGESMSGVSSSMDAFNRMEAKADEMLDKANAQAELNNYGAEDTNDLMAKYDSNVDGDLAALKVSQDVEDELAALKAKTVESVSETDSVD
jgi:phage shock protein A